MKPLPKWLLMAGLLLCVGGPMVGFLVTVCGMIGAFQSLGNSGITNPQDLSNHIGTALTGTAAGLVVSIGLGVPCIIVAVVIHFATRGTRSLQPPPSR